MTISAAYGHRRGLALLASLSLALLAAPAAHAGCHCGNGCAVDSSWLGGAYTGPITFYGKAACAAANRLPTKMNRLVCMFSLRWKRIRICFLSQGPDAAKASSPVIGFAH